MLAFLKGYDYVNLLEKLGIEDVSCMSSFSCSRIYYAKKTFLSEHQMLLVDELIDHLDLDNAHA